MENQIRQQIYRKIRRIPDNKLKDLADYLNELEHTDSKVSKALSFAGCWNNIDDSALDDLTENLNKNRNRNFRRFDE